MDAHSLNPLHMVIHTAVEQLLLARDKRFAGDEDFLVMLEAIFLVKLHSAEIRESMRTALESHGVSYVEVAEAARSDIENLDTLAEQLSAQMDARLELTRREAETSPDIKLPRIVRLCEKLELSSKETCALHFVILHNCGTKFPPPSKTYEARGMIRNMALLASMNPTEILNFLSPSRRYMKEGVFQSEAGVLVTDYSSQTLSMTKEVLSALMGASLTGEEFLVIDKTALAEVLIEEGFDPLNHTVGAGTLTADGDFSGVDVSDADVQSVLEMIKSEMSSSALADDGAPGEEDADSASPTEEASRSATPSPTADGEAKQDEFSKYTDDLEYLRDHFQIVSHRLALYANSLENPDGYRLEKTSIEQKQRELKNKARQAVRKCEVRVERTLAAGGWIPRLEKLKRLRSLDDFEKMIILSLIGSILSLEMRKIATRSHHVSIGRDSLTVGMILAIHCNTLSTQITHRKYFYKNSTLVKENIIKIAEPSFGNMDLMSCFVSIDRRMVDYCVALDVEFGALVEGSQLYTPTVSVDQVVLPSKTKRQILQSVENLEKFRALKKDLGFDDILDYGRGVVILFHGISGTGKTMMANALANHLERKVLLVDFATLPNGGSADSLRLVFREAKIQNAVVFMDECEALFESRDIKRDFSVNVVLNAIEQYDDLLILATNRPFDLDEAMHRRITLSVEFLPPSIHLRESILKELIPAKLRLDESVDLQAIAMDYELTGGFIKNAVLTALKYAMSRDPSDIYLTHEDLDRACKEQIHGQLQLVGFERRFVPERPLDSIVLSTQNQSQVSELIRCEKGRKVLQGQWGFREFGTFVGLVGPPGTGKSVCAEAIAYECGRPLKLISCAEVITAYRMPSRQKASQQIFSEVNSGAIVVVEGAEVLFRSRTLHAEVLGFVAFQLDVCKGMVIFVATMTDTDFLESNVVLDRIEFMLKFDPPDASMRQRMWQSLIPSRVPLHESINESEYAALAKKFSEFSGKSIQRVITRSSIEAALRKDPSRRVLTGDDLQHAASNERRRIQGGLSFSQSSNSMYR